MGLIPQTKCGRCDRTYSSLRSRCPYCGAHRHKKGKRATDNDNSTWKIIIGILLIVVLIAAVIVIVVTSANDKGPSGDSTGDSHNNSSDGVQGSPGGSTDDSTDDSSNPNTEDSTDDSTNPGTDSTDDSSDLPVQVIATSITVHKGNSRTEATDFMLHVGDTYNVTAVVTPSNATSIPTWTCDNPSALTIIPDETGMKATLTVTGTGSVNVTVSVDSLDYTFVVRCRK